MTFYSRIHVGAALSPMRGTYRSRFVNYGKPFNAEFAHAVLGERGVVREKPGDCPRHLIEALKEPPRKL